MLNIFNWRRRYFSKKLRDIEKMILDLQFKRFKTREIREEIRQAYDQTQSRLSVLNDQIKSQQENPTLEKGEIARLDDDKVRLEKDIERYKRQIDSLDIEVFGAKPSNEFPDGVQGINNQLDSLEELKLMVRDYKKSL